MTTPSRHLSLPDLVSGLPWGPAICYSGYRNGQSPDSGIFPSENEIRQDLDLLQPHWAYLRLYDCSLHARRVLNVIKTDGLPFKVMLGAYLAAEASNPACPWGGGVHTEEQLALNRALNHREVETLAELAASYPDIVCAVAVGNECTVDWTDHLVPVEHMVSYVRRIRQTVRQPVTFCENYVPWLDKLAPLVAELDFISLHTYPVWEYKPVHEALAYTQHNLTSVAQRWPGKPIVITEAGWATRSNGRGIPHGHANEEWQSIYCQELMDWSRESGVLVYVFEAFDESWKGSPDPLEPEKHWGLFTEHRNPKPAMHQLIDTLSRDWVSEEK